MLLLCEGCYILLLAVVCCCCLRQMEDDEKLVGVRLTKDIVGVSAGHVC
jgi:hypothetical protein